MVEIAEWWLELTTPDQCGENPVVQYIGKDRQHTLAQGAGQSGQGQVHLMYY